MLKTSIMLDQETKELLSQVSAETGVKHSTLIRQFIHEGIERRERKSLSANQKKAILAAIQSQYLLEKLVDKSL